MPNPLPNPFIHDGAVSNDGLIKDLLSCGEQQLFVSASPVTLTNPTAATDLVTFTIGAPTGGAGISLNSAGKVIVISAFGVYSLGAASTLVFTVKLGGATLATFTTASQATTAVTLAWQLSLTSVTVTPGAAGTAEAHGYLSFDSGATLAAACSEFLDSNTAAITSINYTGPLLLELMANLGTGNAGSTITSRIVQVELYN
jgi:hypothetical protein